MTATAPGTMELKLERFMRRRSLVGKTLSVPLDVHSDECLWDLLLRATAENGHLHVNHVLDMLSGNGERPRGGYEAAHLDTWIDRRALRDVLGLSSTENSPPFEKSVNRGVQSFFGTTIRNAQLSMELRVSPLSLREALYCRAVWRVKSLCFDPVTRELLLERCPVCCQTLSPTNTLGLQYCWACRFGGALGREGYQYVDLRDFPQPLVEVVDEDALNFATSLIDPRSFGIASPTIGLHDDFACLDRGEIFHFIAVLAKHQISFGYASGATLPNEVERRGTVGRFLPPTVLAEAARMVLEWPLSFRDFVSHVRQKRPDDRDYVSIFFRSHGFKAKFRDTIFRLINDERRCDREWRALRPSEPLAVENDSSFGEAWAAVAKRMPRAEFKALTTFIEQGDGRGVAQAQVRLTILKQKSGVQSLANSIGVPTYELFRMVDQQLLSDNIVDLEDRMSVKEGAQELFADLATQSVKGEMPERFFSLARVVNALSLRLEQPWSYLLRAARDGAFEYWLERHRGTSLLRSIYVNDVTSICTLLANAPRSSGEWRTVYVSNMDAATTLCVPLASIPDFARHGLLTSPTTIGVLHSIRSRYLLACEIPPRLKANVSISNRAAADRMRAGRIAGLNGRPLTLWDRSQAEALFGSEIAPCIRD